MDYFEKMGDRLSGDFEKIGRLLSEKMGRGIAVGADSAQKALETMNADLLSSQKKYMDDIDSLERKMEEEEEAKYRREYQQKLQKAKTAEQAEIIRQNESYRLQKKANDRYMEALEEHLKNIEAKVKAQKKAIISEFDEIAERMSDSLEEVEKAKSRMEEKMTSYAPLFSVKQTTFLNSGFKGSKEIFEDTVLDLSKERANLTSYADLLNQVREKENIPSELYRAILNLPIDDAIRYQNALLSMGNDELESYLEDWQAIQSIAKETARESYAEDIRHILQTVDDALNAWYGTVPEGFFNEGQLSAEAFGDGFIQKLQDMQDMFRSAALSLFGSVSVERDGTNGSNVHNINNSNAVTYVLNSAGETVSEQLRTARGHAAVLKLRGDFSGASV